MSDEHLSSEALIRKLRNDIDEANVCLDNANRNIDAQAALIDELRQERRALKHDLRIANEKIETLRRMRFEDDPQRQ